MAEKYRVKLMSRALRDLDEIYQHIAHSLLEPDIALRFLTEIEQAILSLEYLPQRCALRKVGSYANKHYRQLFIKNFTVIFRIDESSGTVIIVTVRYSASKF